MGYILLNNWAKLSQRLPFLKYHKLLLSLLFALHNMMVRPHCKGEVKLVSNWKFHPNSLVFVISKG